MTAPFVPGIDIIRLLKRRDDAERPLQRFRKGFFRLREQAIAPYPDVDGSLPLHKTAVERAWAAPRRGVAYNATGVDEDARQSEMATVTALWSALSRASFADLRSLDCPLVLFAGEQDMVTPAALVTAVLPLAGGHGADK